MKLLRVTREVLIALLVHNILINIMLRMCSLCIETRARKNFRGGCSDFSDFIGGSDFSFKPRGGCEIFETNFQSYYFQNSCPFIK